MLFFFGFGKIQIYRRNSKLLRFRNNIFCSKMKRRLLSIFTSMTGIMSNIVTPYEPKSMRERVGSRGVTK